MNKGFLTFSEDQPGLTMLKDEPEDLTHLAPTAGDVCVPLEEPPFLTEMLDEFILSGNYCPLLSPEEDPLADAVPCEASPTKVRGPGGLDPLRRDACASPEASDPFIYRDSPSRCSLGTDLHSPTLTKSPGSGIGESLSSPNGSGGGLSEDEILMLSISDVMADDELALRAPYIPMSDQDEALQLLISDDMVMWGPSQNTDKKSKWLNDTGEENANSSLAQLLTNEATSKRIREHGATLVNPSHVLGQVGLKNIARDGVGERERSNKRVHAYSSKSSPDTKRIKSEGDGAAADAQASLESMLSASVQGSQLLQQLVSQQMPKSRAWPAEGRLADSRDRFEEAQLCRLNDDGGGQVQGAGLRRTIFEDDGGGRLNPQLQQQQQQQQQQSNSVLMNLLVSGCDVSAGYVCLTKQNPRSSKGIASK